MRFSWCACGVLLVMGLALVGCQKEIPEEMFLKGFDAFKQNDMIGAALYFDKFIEKYPDSEHVPRAYLFMARARLRLGEYESAEKDLRMLVRKYPESNEGVSAALELADYYARGQRNPEKAEKEIRDILSHVAEETKQQFLLKAASYYIGAATQPERSESIFKEVISNTEDKSLQAECYRGIAQAYISSGTDTERPVQALYKAIDLLDGDQKVDGYFEVAGIYVRADELDKAVAVYRKIIDDVTADSEGKAMAYLLMSKGYERENDMGKAMDALEELRREYPDTDVAILSYVQSALFLKDSSPELSDEFLDKGLRAFGRVRDESPESDRAAWAQMKIAEAYAMIGDSTKAIDALGKSISDFPHMPQYVEMARNQIRMLRMQQQEESSSGEEIESAT